MHIFPTVPRADITVPNRGTTFVLLFARPNSVIFSSVSRTNVRLEADTSFPDNHDMLPIQYSWMDRLGVPPPRRLILSNSDPIFHPLGINPNSLSTNSPSRKGSKSANQLLKIAWAWASRFSLILLFNSILASRQDKVSVITFWVGRGGSFAQRVSKVLLVIVSKTVPCVEPRISSPIFRSR